MTKILLVEDNEMNRDMLARRLSRKGFDVVLATNGEEALSQAASTNPAVILMDLSLPVMDGWEATRRLKADPDLKAIPVIALTAHAIESDREEALRCGCDDFDTKPIDIKRLLSKVENFLG